MRSCSALKYAEMSGSSGMRLGPTPLCYDARANKKEDLMSTVVHKIALCAVLSLALAAASQAAPETAGPSAIAPVTPIVAPKDRAYAGEIQLKVDAGDTNH